MPKLAAQIGKSYQADEAAAPLFGFGDRVDGSLLTFDEAAAYASKCLRMRFEPRDISSLLRLNLISDLTDSVNSLTRVRAADLASYGVLLGWRPEHPAIETLLMPHSGRHGDPLPSGDIDRGWIVLTITSSLWFFVEASDFRPYECQLLLRELRNDIQRFEVNVGTPYRSVVVHARDAYFRSSSSELAEFAAEVWKTVLDRADEASNIERRITPSIYGVKTRLIPFVTSVIRSVSAKEAAVCDMMCGSGIVSRKLARTHLVFSNDANPYGQVLVQALTSRVAGTEIESSIERLKSNAATNVRALEELFAPYIVNENKLFHSARTQSTIDEYREFCAEVPSFFGGATSSSEQGNTVHARLRSMILARRSTPQAFPFVLATAYWANVHFGLRQCILLDSLRYSIESEPPALRNVLLAALLQAALTCSSGPHFAQPFKPKGPNQFKALIAKRSRRIDAEFFGIVSQYASLPSSGRPLLGATTRNWREALHEFTGSIDGRGVVYLDPPYTPVQYSRYYHVLNVLVQYDYPECHGPGRCPVRSYRFSSRFEFKRGPAKKELHHLIQECANAGVDLIMSYSMNGAISVREIIDMLEAHYETIELFQTGIRHHAQGKAAPAGRLNWS